MDQVRFDSIRRRRWTVLETIYIVERIAVELGEEPMLRQATFILKREGRPTFPDFRVWNELGPLYVYAHDRLANHADWNMADDRNQFVWEAVYLDIIPPHVGIQVPHDEDIGLQLANAPEEEENHEDENEANEEEEEEEDPEEDPNWVDEEMEVIPEPPAMEEENVQEEPNPMLWDFDQALDIPDCGRIEEDNVVWRDVHEVNAFQGMAQGVGDDPMELENEEEAGREARIDTNVGNGQEAAEEEEDEEPENLTRPPRRRRLTVRAYLSQFVRRDDGSSSSRSRLPDPTPGDSE